MTPEEIEELANMADPEQLWKRAGMDRILMSGDQRNQLDTGVALRRHASHLRRLRELLTEKRSLLITPLAPNVNATMDVDTPARHQKLRREQSPNAEFTERRQASGGMPGSAPTED